MGKLITAPVVIGSIGLGILIFSDEKKMDNYSISKGDDIPFRNIGYALFFGSIVYCLVTKKK